VVQLLPLPEHAPLQHRPPTQTPDEHSPPSVQVEPLLFLAEQVLELKSLQYWVPLQQLLVEVTLPQDVVPEAQTHAPVVLQVLPLPEHGPLQHWPPTQTPDEHSVLPTQLAPSLFFAEQVLTVGSLQYWMAPSQQLLVEVTVPHAA
jgi:hypothetical protein